MASDPPSSRPAGAQRRSSAAGERAKSPAPESGAGEPTRGTGAGGRPPAPLSAARAGKGRPLTNNALKEQERARQAAKNSGSKTNGAKTGNSGNGSDGGAPRRPLTNNALKEQQKAKQASRAKGPSSKGISASSAAGTDTRRFGSPSTDRTRGLAGSARTRDAGDKGAVGSETTTNLKPNAAAEAEAATAGAAETRGAADAQAGATATQAEPGAKAATAASGSGAGARPRQVQGRPAAAGNTPPRHAAAGNTPPRHVAGRRPPPGGEARRPGGQGRPGLHGPGGPGRPTGPRRPAGPSSPRRSPERARAAKRLEGPHWWRYRKPVFGAIFVSLAMLGGFLYYDTQQPLPKAPALAQTSIVYDSQGHEMATFSATENRINVPVSQVSPTLIKAIVATEDRHFFSEGALDPLSIARALMNDLEGGNLQGGSTITQQYVKQTYTSRQRNLLRKLKEALLAEKVQRDLTKNQILGDYLNTIYFGRGAYGVQAASQAYFNTDVSKLSIGQSALLAGLIRNPEGFDPAYSLQAAQQRQSQVLAGMVRDKAITQDQANKTEQTPMPSYTVMSPTTGNGTSMNAHNGDEYFVAAVRQQLIQTYGAAKVYSGGLRVTTTLDPQLQQGAYQSVYGAPKGLNPETGTPAGALVSVDNNGNVRALVGGQDYNRSQVDLALGTQGGGSGRQAGSTFKAFLLAQLIKDGYSVQSTLPAPFEVTVAHGNTNGTDWPVTNFAGDPPSPQISVVQATAHSVNTAFAQMVEKITPAQLVQSAVSMGIPASELSPNPSLVLGTSDVSPLQMASGYSTFAANGAYHTPSLIAKVLDDKNKPVPLNVPPPNQVLTPQQDAIMTYCLTQVVNGGTGYNAAVPGVPLAGKTGTSTGAADAWFIGYSPTLTTAIWMGYPGSSRSLDGWQGIQNYQGGDQPAQIFHQYMQGAVQAQPQWRGQGFPNPPNLAAGQQLNLTESNQPGISFVNQAPPTNPPGCTPPGTTQQPCVFLPTPQDPNPIQPTPPPGAGAPPGGPPPSGGSSPTAGAGSSPSGGTRTSPSGGTRTAPSGRTSPSGGTSTPRRG